MNDHNSPALNVGFVKAASSASYFTIGDLPKRHILDTSAWNALFDDSDSQAIVGHLESTTILPTTLAISELAATEDETRRLALIRLVKRSGGSNRPLASPNQLIILACQGFARRDRMLTLNGGEEAQGAWVVLNRPDLIDGSLQRLTLEFNAEREQVLRDWNEELRKELQLHFHSGVTRPRSIGGLIRHYRRNEDFLYRVVSPIYERAVGIALPRNELWQLLNSVPHWRMFLVAYACAIYQRSVQEENFSYRRNPGHLDLWSAMYLPFCDVFVTNDKRQRRALKVLNKASSRQARIMSFAEWKTRLLSQ